ncbi:MAG: hypothetical protein ACLU0O_03420 [Collinsella sp.]
MARSRAPAFTSSRAFASVVPASRRSRARGQEPADDIDAIANQYFDTSAKKINVQTIIRHRRRSTADARGLIGLAATPISPRRAISLSTWRSRCGPTTTAVGAEFGNRNH